MSDDERRDGSFKIIRRIYPFENLVALDARWPGNRLGRRFPVDLLLEVEAHQLAVPGRPGLWRRIGQGFTRQTEPGEKGVQLRVRLRHCYVRCQSNDLTIVPESKYQCPISEGKVTVRTSDKSSVMTGSQGKFGVQIKTDLKPTMFDASLAAQADSNFARKAAHTTEEISEIQPEILEVMAVPNGWRVGHFKYGDPIKDSYCLDGRYFRRPVTGFPQSCEFEFREQGRSTLNT